MSNPTNSRPEPSQTGGPNAASEAWEHAVQTFRAWVGPLHNRPLQTARQRYFAFCQTRRNAADFLEAAPMIAFGFLTRSAFVDAERKTDLYARR